MENVPCCDYYSKKNGAPIPTPNWKNTDQVPSTCTCGKYGQQRDCYGYTPLRNRTESLTDPAAISFQSGKADFEDRKPMCAPGTYAAPYFRGYLEAALSFIEEKAKDVPATHWKHESFSVEAHWKETIDNVNASGSRSSAIFVMAHILDLIGVELGQHSHDYDPKLFNSEDVRRRDLHISTKGMTDV